MVGGKVGRYAVGMVGNVMVGSRTISSLLVFNEIALAITIKFTLVTGEGEDGYELRVGYFR